MRINIKLLGLCIVLFSPNLSASLEKEEQNNTQTFYLHQEELPQEILVSIFEFLPNLDQARLVCKKWYHASMDSACILPEDDDLLRIRFQQSSPDKFAWLARNDPKGKSKIFPWITRFYMTINPETNKREPNWENSKKVGRIESILFDSGKPSIFEFIKP